MDSRLLVTCSHSVVKFTHAAVGHLLLHFEFPDPVSEESEFLFGGFFAQGVAHRCEMRAGQRKRHGGRDDFGRSGGCGARTGGEFGVWGRGHE